MNKPNTEVLPLPERLVLEAKAMPADAIKLPERVRKDDQPVLLVVAENLRPYYGLFRSKAEAIQELNRQKLKAIGEAKTQAGKGAALDEYDPQIVRLTRETMLAKRNFWGAIEASLLPEHAEKNLSVCAAWEIVESVPEISMYEVNSFEALRTIFGLPSKCGDPDCPNCNPKE